MKRVEVLASGCADGAGSIRHAHVIRVHGVSWLGVPPAFRLCPVADNDASRFGWPRGDQRPVSVRAGLGYIDLLLRDELLKYAALKAGAGVRLCVPSLGVDTQITWPSSPQRPKSTGRLILGHVKDGPEREARTLPVVAMVDPKVSVSNRAEMDPEASPGACARPDLKSVPPLIVGAEVSVAPRTTGLSRLKARPPDALRVSDETSQAEAAQQITVHAPPVPRYRSLALPVILATVALIASFVAVIRMHPNDAVNTQASAIAEKLMFTVSAMTSAVAGRKLFDVAEPKNVISEILMDAEGRVDTGRLLHREALEHANDALSGAQTPQERRKAAFWLRTVLAKSLSEPRLTWAVTQLGAAYTETGPGQKADYAAAFLLWRWAADAGDPQAACFLGRLYLDGRGVAVDLEAAAKELERARRLGGCPELQSTLARLSELQE